MLVRFYTLTWVLGISTALLFYISGNLTPVITVVFGILTAATVFLGLIAVLPSSIAEKNHESEMTEHRGEQPNVQRPLAEKAASFDSRSEKVFEQAHAFNQRP